MRYTDDGKENPDFELNQPAYRKARRSSSPARNFGCGSSREHAPWALLDYGFRCVIAPSFADIFYNNCFKNGMLPIELAAERGRQADGRRRARRQRRVTIDLEKQEIRGPDGGCITFDLDPFRKHCLLNGLDDIGLTLEKAPAIESFEAKNKTAQPWLWKSAGATGRSPV